VLGEHAAAERIDLAKRYRLHAGALQPDRHTADSAENVEESERWNHAAAKPATTSSQNEPLAARRMRSSCVGATG
jgi:hypothetical protein